MTTLVEKSEKANEETTFGSVKVYTEDQFREFITKNVQRHHDEQMIVKKLTPHFFRLRFLKRVPRRDSIIDDIQEVRAFVAEIVETPAGLEIITHPD